MVRRAMATHKGTRRGPRVQHLARIAALAALGKDDPLEEAFRAARADSVPIRAVRETLLQTFLFAGFPRCVNALEVLERAHGRLPASPPETLPWGNMRRNFLRRRGLDLFRQVYGDDARGVLERIGRRHLEFRDWIIVDAYGKVLARPGLAVQERECVAIAILATLDLPSQQVAHIRGALRCGATPEEVEGAIAAVEGIAPREAIRFARRRLKAELEAAAAAPPATPSPGTAGSPRRGRIRR